MFGSTMKNPIRNEHQCAYSTQDDDTTFALEESISLAARDPPIPRSMSPAYSRIQTDQHNLCTTMVPARFPRVKSIQEQHRATVQRPTTNPRFQRVATASWEQDWLNTEVSIFGTRERQATSFKCRECFRHTSTQAFSSFFLLPFFSSSASTAEGEILSWEYRYVCLPCFYHQGTGVTRLRLSVAEYEWSQWQLSNESSAIYQNGQWAKQLPNSHCLNILDLISTLISTKNFLSGSQPSFSTTLSQLKQGKVAPQVHLSHGNSDQNNARFWRNSESTRRCMPEWQRVRTSTGTRPGMKYCFAQTLVQEIFDASCHRRWHSRLCWCENRTVPHLKHLGMRQNVFLLEPFHFDKEHAEEQTLILSRITVLLWIPLRSISYSALSCLDSTA